MTEKPLARGDVLRSLLVLIIEGNSGHSIKAEHRNPRKIGFLNLIAIPISWSIFIAPNSGFLVNPPKFLLLISVLANQSYFRSISLHSGFGAQWVFKSMVITLRWTLLHCAPLPRLSKKMMSGVWRLGFASISYFFLFCWQWQSQ